MVRASRRQILRELRQRGLLLVTDRVLPSLVGMVSGEPVRGSWWAHPKAEEIYTILESLEGDEALIVKLVSKKTDARAPFSLARTLGPRDRQRAMADERAHHRSPAALEERRA